MLNYIRTLEEQLNNTSDEKEKFDIIELLRKEKESCNIILSECLGREKRLGGKIKIGEKNISFCDNEDQIIKTIKLCEYEDQIIKKINTILNNNR